MEEFKYLGTTLTNKNSIQEETKSRLKLGNACYYLVQNISKSVVVYTGYVVTEHEGNMNTLQYYS